MRFSCGFIFSLIILDFINFTILLWFLVEKSITLLEVTKFSFELKFLTTFQGKR